MVLQSGKKLKYKKWKEIVIEPTNVIDTKKLEVHWPTYRRKPKRYHPWR